MKTDKKSLTRKIAIISISLSAAAITGFFLFSGMMKADTPSYTEGKVILATDSKVIEASGNIESIRQSDLSFASVGLISAVYVRLGQKVRDGEALAALDDSEQRYNYLNAQQKLEQNRLTGNIRQTTLAELELAMRKTELDRAKITAPFAGFISSLNVESGEYVSNGKIAMTLVDRSTLVATLQIDEVDISLVRMGQRVVFTFDALSGRSLDGEVSLIPPVGKITSQGLAVFNVEAKINNPPDDLLPGFSFSAQIIVREPKSYLSIPGEALVDIPAEQQPDADGSIPAETAPAAAETGQGAKPGSRAGTAQGTRQLPANLSPEQLKLLLARRQANLASGGAGAAGLEQSRPSRPMPMACLVPGANGKPEPRKFLGLKRSDGTIAVLQGFAEGDIILLPEVQKKKIAAKTVSTGFGIPGLGGPPPGGQNEGNRR